MDEINWETLHHAYGPATDIPFLLSQLASDDEVASGKAIGTLFGNIYHQGTRWEASAYILPFLFELVENIDTKNRASIVNLILHLALGDDFLRVETLPFNPEKAFAREVELSSSAQIELTKKFYDESKVFEERELALVDNLVVLWAKKCYQQVENNFDRLCQLINDADISVAKIAISGLPWFPNHLKKSTEPLLVLLQQECPHELKATAILTMGLLPVCDEKLIEQLKVFAAHKEPFYLQLAGIIALINAGVTVHTDAKSVLNEAVNQRVEVNKFGQKIPFERPLIGFVANAKRRLAMNADL